MNVNIIAHGIQILTLTWIFKSSNGKVKIHNGKRRRYYEASAELNKIKEWYNGYIFGEQVIYNPWSVLNYLKRQKEGFMPYWINSSSNDLIKKLLVRGRLYCDIKIPNEEVHIFYENLINLQLCLKEKLQKLRKGRET